MIKITYLKAQMNKPKFDFAVGGQAVIEGVMMRSKNFVAIAVRNEEKKILIKDFEFHSVISKRKYLNIPILRGVINMFEMMVVGMKALNWSADVFITEEPEKGENKPKSKVWQTIIFASNMVFSLVFAIVMFKFIPIYLTESLNKITPQLQDNYILYNLTDGLIKVLIFIIYIVAITYSKTIHRVFEYHGAEHKSVFNYEHETPLTPENATKESRFHPRCGTSFIIFVFLISILVYTFIPRHPDFVIHLLRRLAILPIIAGISYEVLKFSAKHSDNFFIKLFTMPGLAFQRLTTKEPSLDQLEVALAALKRTLELEAKQ